MKYRVSWQWQDREPETLVLATATEARQALQTLHARSEMHGRPFRTSPRYHGVMSVDELILERELIANDLMALGQKILTGDVGPSEARDELDRVRRHSDRVFFQLEAIELEAAPGQFVG